MPTEYVWVDAADLRFEVAKKAECTCPACHTVWSHQDSLDWIREHFSSRTEPIECPECGVRSVSRPGKRMGPRKLYVEPQSEPEPVQTRTERRSWWRRAKEEVADYDYSR